MRTTVLAIILTFFAVSVHASNLELGIDARLEALRELNLTLDLQAYVSDMADGGGRSVERCWRINQQDLVPSRVLFLPDIRKACAEFLLSGSGVNRDVEILRLQIPTWQQAIQSAIESQLTDFNNLGPLVR